MFIIASYSFWALADLILWATDDINLIMFLWSSMIFLELFVYIGSFYFLYVFIYGKDLRLSMKTGIFLFFVPLMLFVANRVNLSYFDLTNCDREASEGILWQYTYIIESLFVVFIIIEAILGLKKAKREATLPKMLWVTIGIVLFLVSFAWGNISGSISEDWSLGQFGLFGLPIFIGFLAYAIVKYQVLNIKILGVQMLTATITILIGVQLFFIQSSLNRILTAITLFLVVIFGLVLIRSVKKEIEQKEQYEKISHTLAIANERLKELDATKSEFISIASHQLRTPLTAIKGYLSLLLEGSYGSVSPQVLDILNKLYLVNSRLVHLVEDLLNVSRIEAGRIQYNFEPTQLEPIIVDLVEMFKSSANEKNLTLDIHLPKTALPLITVDPNKIKEVVSNLIDNSIKYTKVGGTTVTLERTPLTARIIISDTGIGIHPEDMKNLFQKFLRSKETTKMVVSGAGLGLYVGKSFIEAHGGTIWAESDGPDKGARFIIELPLHNEKIKVGTSDEPTSAEKG